MPTTVGCAECRFGCHVQKTCHQQYHQRLRVRKHGSRGKVCGLDMQLASLQQWETYILLVIWSLQNLQITVVNKEGKGHKFQVSYKLCMQSQRFSVKQSNKQQQVSWLETREATIYHIWRDKNKKVHDVKVRSEVELLKTITSDVTGRLASKTKVKNTIQNRALCCLWGIPLLFFVFKLLFMLQLSKQ